MEGTGMAGPAGGGREENAGAGGGEKPLTGEAATVREEAKLPMGRFLIRELRKLLAPVLAASIAGGGTAWLGWNVQGRGQASEDAATAAREQVLELEELRSFVRGMRSRGAGGGTGGTAPVESGGVIVVPRLDRAGAERLLEEYARRRAGMGKATDTLAAQRPPIDAETVMRLAEAADAGTGSPAVDRR